MMKRIIGLLLIANFGFGSVLFGEEFKPIDLKNLDTSVRLQDDFYQYANGTWLKNNPVPPEQGYWGSFIEIDERNKVDLKKILERTASQKTGTGVEKQVGDFYASGMDTAAIDAAGIGPLEPELAKIRAAKSTDEFPALIAHLHAMGVNIAFAFGAEPDPKNSDMMISSNGQAGLGLPERDYYFRDDEKTKMQRVQYREHVARMLQLAGASSDTARLESEGILKLETALAKVSKKRAELRDPVANYHKMSLADLQKLSPHFDWQTFFVGLGLPNPGDIDVSQPDFISGFDAELSNTPLDTWKAYFRWQLLHHAAPFLSTPFVDENFAFYGKTLNGVQKLRERWKRVLNTVDSSIGEGLGQLYVKDYFPPESKTYMLKLIGNLRAALREKLQSLPWMDEKTRAQALLKLDAFTVKVGYPDKWIDYSALKIDRVSYVLNVFNASRFNSHRDIAKIGKPADRTEWDMTPPTVNAYYNPQFNEIVFPAGVLQPPFYYKNADDAINYGAIGSVIGHEMTHGFDDEGRQFDAKGNLMDWWTPESAEQFKLRSAAIVKQYSAYVPLDDLHINGELTQGENIADNGGVKIAYAALQKALKEKPAPAIIDGFTPEQRFFLSFATSWRMNATPEAKRNLILTDPHSPEKFRVLGALSNMEEFAKAFAIPEGSPMVRPKDQRVDIW